MKKLFLLMALGSVAMNAGAQTQNAVSGSQPTTNERIGSGHINPIENKYLANPSHGGAAKTTTGGDRWYNYTDYIRLKAAADMAAGTGAQYVDFYSPLIWNDTIAVQTFPSSTGAYTVKHVNLPSLGMSCHPQFPGFNRMDLYGTGSMMRLTNTDAFVVDTVSLQFFYSYGTKSTAGHKDTVRLAIMHGTGASKTSTPATDVFAEGVSAGSHYAAITFPDVAYDSTKNVAVSNGSTTGTPCTYYDIILTNADTSSFNQVKKYTLPTPINCQAGDFVTIALSYKSGEPAAALHTLPGDTVVGVGGRYYNLFQPYVWYMTLQDPTAVANTTPDWANYLPDDHNTGLFKTWPNYSNGWINTYVCNWAWSSVPSGAYYYQFPDIGYHITCSTCSDVPLDVKTAASVTSITATPNPASNELNVKFSLVKASDVTVSLTNMVGQVVATQKLGTVANGNAVFNTTTLPSGVYMYTLEANGERSTGRVAVAH